MEKYKDKSTIFNISAWSPDPALMGFSPDYPWDVYFIPRFNSWGWASWKDRWQSIDWDLQEAETFFNDPYAVRAFCQGGADMPGMLQAQIEGRINSWSVRADFARFCQGRLGLNPIHSYVENIGLDGSGTHCGEIPQFIVDLKKASATPRLPDYIFVDEEFEKGYRALCSGPLWVSPEEEEKRRTAAELANVAAELAHAHDQCEYFEQAMRIQQAELASYENSKAVQGILQLKDICRRRAWRQLPGWGWWAVRFVYQKLFCHARQMPATVLPDGMKDLHAANTPDATSSMLNTIEGKQIDSQQ